MAEDDVGTTGARLSEWMPADRAWRSDEYEEDLGKLGHLSYSPEEWDRLFSYDWDVEYPGVWETEDEKMSDNTTQIQRAADDASGADNRDCESYHEPDDDPMDCYHEWGHDQTDWCPSCLKFYVVVVILAPEGVRKAMAKDG